MALKLQTRVILGKNHAHCSCFCVVKAETKCQTLKMLKLFKKPLSVWEISINHTIIPEYTE